MRQTQAKSMADVPRDPERREGGDSGERTAVPRQGECWMMMMGVSRQNVMCVEMDV